MQDYGEIMSEELTIPSVNQSEEANKALENARIAHQKYLIKQQIEDIDRAILYYVDAIKFNPKLAEAYYRLASLMWEKGQISVESAIEQCKTAITLEPENVNAHIYTGYFYSLANDYINAEKEFKIAISKHTENSARPRLFLSSLIQKRMEIEGKTLSGMMKYLYYFLTGSVLFMSDLPALKMMYKSIADNFSVISYKTIGATLEKIRMFPTAFNTYSMGMKKTEHGDIFYKKLGDLSLECNDVVSSLEYYKNALKTTPDNREILIKLATIMQTYFPEEIDTIIDYYNRLLEFGIDNGKIYYELGHLYLRRNDKINSISAFKLALGEEPCNPYYNNSLAYALVRAELFDDAIEYYQNAIKLNPDPSWTSIVCHALGALYGEVKGNFEAAEATFQAGLVLDSNNYELLLSLGDLFMAQGNLDKAIKTYCDGITLNPDNFLAYAKAGLALWEKDYIEEALVSLHKAVDLNPDFEVAHNNLGVVYLDGIGDAGESINHFMRAIEINPNYTLAYFNVGRAYQAMDEKASSAEYYQMALDLNQVTQELDNHDIKERLHRLFE